MATTSLAEVPVPTKRSTRGPLPKGIVANAAGGLLASPHPAKIRGRKTEKIRANHRKGVPRSKPLVNNREEYSSRTKPIVDSGPSDAAKWLANASHCTLVLRCHAERRTAFATSEGRSQSKHLQIWELIERRNPHWARGHGVDGVEWR